MVPGLSRLSYEERLRKMNLPSLMYRRIIGDAIEAYTYLHGIYKVDCSELRPLYEQGSIRGHCLKLKKRGFKTQLRQNFFENHIVNVWNSLPTEVVTASKSSKSQSIY